MPILTLNTDKKKKEPARCLLRDDSGYKRLKEDGSALVLPAEDNIRELEK